MFTNFVKRRNTCTYMHTTMHWKQQKRQQQTELGQTLIKESTTHLIEQTGQWPTNVALDTLY